MKPLGLILLLGAPSYCAAETARNMPLAPYESQGGFVVEPAKFVAAPVYGVGFVAGALVCLPVTLVQVGSTQDTIPREREASLVCGKYAGTGLGWPVYAAVGLPLYILKQTFWDGPRAFARWVHWLPPAPSDAPTPAPAPAE